MAQGVGARWLSEVSLASTDTNDYYGATGGWLTHEQIAADEAANKVVRVYPGEKSTLTIKPLQQAIFDRGSATAANGPRLEVYGVMGFGEVNSDAWASNKLMAIKLGGKVVQKGTRSNASVSDATQLTGPDGFTYHGVQQDVHITDLTSGGEGSAQAEFIAMQNLEEVSSAPHAGVTGTFASGTNFPSGDGGDGGIYFWQGCQSFQMLLLAHNKANWVSSYPNFVVSLH